MRQKQMLDGLEFMKSWHHTLQQVVPHSQKPVVKPMSNTAQLMPNYYAAETEARELIAAKQVADENFEAGLADPLIGHFIKRLCPEEPQEINERAQV